MNNTSSIITIGREYGSGGRQIGKEIANYFGIKYYDKELLEHAANDSGICKELFEHHDEKPTNSFLYSLVMDTYSFGYSSAGFSDMPMNHKIFLAQFDAIKKLAGEGPCVMVGRCADYALADWKDCFSVFVHADFDWRINRIAAKYNKTPKEARDIITKTDKSRASYYNYYTNKKWGSAKSYNLCIDSSKYGIDNTVKAIVESIKIFDSTKIIGGIFMRLVIQRVLHAEVQVDGNTIGKIGKGLLVFVGAGQDDTKEIADKYLRKLLGLRIFEDENGKTNLSLKDVDGELLIVSQFTLYANCKKGNRPSFIEAGEPHMAEALYEYMIEEAKKSVPVVEHGEFGADMKVSLLNDGPFTVILDEKIL